MATALLPVTSLSYDPVTRTVITPKVDVSPLLGYKGSNFMETGVVYAPYIPRFKTGMLAPRPMSESDKYLARFCRRLRIETPE
jgi:hypothetical protein